MALFESRIICKCVRISEEDGWHTINCESRNRLSPRGKTEIHARRFTTRLCTIYALTLLHFHITAPLSRPSLTIAADATTAFASIIVGICVVFVQIIFSFSISARQSEATLCCRPQTINAPIWTSYFIIFMLLDVAQSLSLSLALCPCMPHVSIQRQ